VRAPDSSAWGRSELPPPSPQKQSFVSPTGLVTDQSHHSTQTQSCGRVSAETIFAAEHVPDGLGETFVPVDLSGSINGPLSGNSTLRVTNESTDSTATAIPPTGRGR
jgi:hypothetical protein